MNIRDRFVVSGYSIIPFLFGNGVRFVYGSSGPAAGGVPMSSRRRGDGGTPVGGSHHAGRRENRPSIR